MRQKPRFTLYLVMLASLAAEASAAETTASGINAAVSLVSLVVGIGLAGLAYLFFHRRIEGWFERFSYTRFGRHITRHHHRDSIADRIYGYYLWNSHDGKEFISPYLRELLRLEDRATHFHDMARVMDEEDFHILSRAAEKLRNGEIHEFYGYVRTLRAGRCLECIGIDRDGSLSAPGFTFWFRDITDQAEQQQSMRQDYQRLKQDALQLARGWEHSTIPMWMRDEHLHIIRWNKAYEDLLGHTPGRNRESQELSTRSREVAEKAASSKAIEAHPCHIVSNGIRARYRVVETPLPQDAHDTARYLGFAIDNRDQETVEDELKRHKSAQAQFLESSASAIAIFGSNMQLQGWNRAYATLWKLDDAMLERHPLYGDILEHLRAKRLLPEEANFQAFKKQNLQLFTALIGPHEEYYYLPDGRVVRVLVIPHALGGLMFVYEDVTDRLALERSYNTLIAVQRATLDQLHEGVAVFAENGRMTLYNPEYASMWNLPPAMLDTEPHLSDVIDGCRQLLARHDELWHQLREHLIRRIMAREPYQGQLELTSGKALDWRVVPLPDGASMVAFYDVTATTLVEESLRDKNKALEEADRVKTEFLANMSYELRSPLTSIMGFSEALGKHYFGELSEKQQEYVEAIHKSSRQLMGLINNILDLAGMEAGYVKLTPTRIPVAALLRETQAMQQQRLNERSLAVITDCAHDMPPMLGDEARIKQILYNLLANAATFSAEGGTITIGATIEMLETVGECICLYVRDEGEGIPPDELPHVFTRFWRGVSPKARAPGAGLGLSMVKRFTELHGGAVAITSELGRGTEVRCYFPRNLPGNQQTRINMMELPQ